MISWNSFTRRKPRSLYKYTSMDSAVRILSSLSLSFTSLRHLNDPLEALAIPPHEPTYREAQIAWSGTKEGGSATPDEIHKDSIELYKKEMECRDLVKKKLDTIGVLCLSENKHDLLMWSHYADAHRGVMIEFDFKELENDLLNVSQQSVFGLSRSLRPVHYARTPPRVRGRTPEKLLDKTLFLKGRHWKYEAEWRAVRQVPAGEKLNLVPFKRSSIVAVYVGANCTDDIFLEFVAVLPFIAPMKRCTLSERDYAVNV